MTINQSQGKISSYATKQYTKTVQGNCGAKYDHLGKSLNKIQKKVDSLGTIVVLIGTEKRHSIDLENLFEVEFENSCKPEYKFLFADGQVPNYI